MRIDRTHKNWLIGSLGLLGVCILLYCLYRVPPNGRPMGGSSLGLAFGVVGLAFMIFAALLGARKRVPIWRIGRAQSWMRGHLWLGLLSLPVILLHSGFRYGYGLSAVLVTLLVIVVASGLFGAVLQHYMPRVMTREVTMETIYEEIGHVRAQLLEEAEELFKQAAAETSKTVAAGASDSTESVSVAVIDEQSTPLRFFFEQELKPFLEKPDARGQALANAAQASSAFAQLRTLVPPTLHTTLEELENICEEERQLSLQARLHVWLHGWLLLHIPLSLVLILLGVIHAVMALRY